jgi:hypothetical protein
MKLRRSTYGAAIAALMLALGAGIVAGATVAPAQPGTGYSAPQLYNLANASARDGKPGLAVLNYERARLLAPSDPDVQANLRYVLEAAGLPAVTGNWFDRHAGLLRSNSCFWLGCIGILLVGAGEIARRVYPRQRTAFGAVSAAGLSGIILALCAAAALWPVMSEAVVIAPTTAQRLAPATLADPLSTLHEAQIVTVEAQRQGFALVQTKAGLAGWVLRADLAPIVPRGS